MTTTAKSTTDRLSSSIWLTAFLPTLLYYILTRTIYSPTHTLFSPTYPPISTHVHVPFGPLLNSHRQTLNELLYLNSNIPAIPSGIIPSFSAFALTYPLELLPHVYNQIQSSTWVHDVELGRGYLLVSSSYKCGRIWRWEVGGGPITIGRSLHMEGSGCRSLPTCPSKLDNNNSNVTEVVDVEGGDLMMGSGGITIEYEPQGEHPNSGKLVVSEWGEGRIIRLEESGTRTPLVINTPNLCSTGGKRNRINKPVGILYSPFGDLIFTDNYKCNSSNKQGIGGDGGAVYRLKEAIHIDPINTMTSSRKAHTWNETTNDDNVEVLLSGMEEVGGMALNLDLTSLFVSVITKGGRFQIVRLGLEEEDETDEDDEEDEQDEKDGKDEEEGKEKKRETNKKIDEAATIFYDLTPHVSKSSSVAQQRPINTAGDVAVDAKGNVYATYPHGGIVILNPKGQHMGTIPLLPPPPTQKSPPTTASSSNNENKEEESMMVPTSVTFGGDKYLYVTTQRYLYRMKVKIGGLEIPTNMVLPKKKKQRV